jgi:hypothetical protein
MDLMSQKYWILGRAVKEEERSGVLSLILIFGFRKEHKIFRYLFVYSAFGVTFTGLKL